MSAWGKGGGVVWKGKERKGEKIEERRKIQSQQGEQGELVLASEKQKTARKCREKRKMCGKIVVERFLVFFFRNAELAVLSE